MNDVIPSPLVNQSLLFQRLRLRLLRKQLSEDAVDGIGGQPSRGEVDLSGWRHDVRLVAHMHDKRFAIDSDNRLQQ